MSVLTINNRHYDCLGDNNFRDSLTGDIVTSDELFESSGTRISINLGSNNVLSGAKIGCRTISPISLKEWGQVSKIALLAAVFLGALGVIGLFTSTLPLFAGISLGAGILLTIPTIFNFRLGG